MRGSLNTRLDRVSRNLAVSHPARFRVVWAEEILRPLPEYQERKAEITQLHEECQALIGDPGLPTPPESLQEARSKQQALAMRAMCEWENDRMAEVDRETLDVAWEALIKVVPTFPGGSPDG